MITVSDRSCKNSDVTGGGGVGWDGGASEPRAAGKVLIYVRAGKGTQLAESSR